MTDILRQLKAARYILKLDLTAALNPIPLEEESQAYMAFTVPGRGRYEFQRVEFELTGAPITFQRPIDSVITPEMRPKLFSYLEDIIKVTETFNEHNLLPGPENSYEVTNIDGDSLVVPAIHTGIRDDGRTINATI